MLDRLLAPIYATQQQLDHDAHHDLRAYAEHAHQHVQQLAKDAGVTIQYGTRQGGYEQIAQPLSQDEQSNDTSRKGALKIF